MLLQRYISSNRRSVNPNTLKIEADRAVADNLPSLYNARYEAGLDKQKLDLEKKSMDLAESNSLRDFGLAKDAQSEAKKQSTISNALGVGKLVLDTYFGFQNKADASNILFGETGKAVTTAARPAGDFVTKSGGDFLLGATETGRLIGSGVGSVAGYLASDWLADKTGMSKSTANIVAPVAGAVIGNVAAPVAQKVATDYLAPAWSAVTKWFGW